MVSLIGQIFSFLTILGQGVIFLLLLSLVFRKKEIVRFFSKRAILFLFAISLTATLGSLFYSEIAGFEPCKLCWFQRIFMYPQVVILALALWRRKSDVALYTLFLSGIGALIAGYHYLLQTGVVSDLPCSAVGYSVDCSQRFVMNFGYITLPMMALTAFLLIVLTSIIHLRAKPS